MTKYFLICDKCGFQNLCDSETLVFCQQCNRKIDNNFLSWSKRYPHKTFQDFQSECCRNDAALNEKDNLLFREKPKFKPYLVYVIVTLTMIISPLVLFYAIKKYQEASTASPVEFLEKNFGKWEEYRFDSVGVTMNLPFKPERVTCLYDNIPKQYQNQITGLETHTKNIDNRFSFMFNAITYSIAQSINLEVAASNVLNDLTTIEGLKNLNYQQQDFQIKGSENTLLLKGSYFENDIEQRFILLVFSRNKVLAQIIFIYDQEKVMIEPQLYRIINSVKIRE